METEDIVNNFENNIEIVEQNETIFENNESIAYFIGVRVCGKNY